MGAIVCGLGIFVLVELSPQNGSILMVFSYIFGDLLYPSIFKSAIFTAASGVVLITYSVVTMVIIIKKLHKHVYKVSGATHHYS